MYFKLAVKNVRKSYKDYILYFMTLALGVCVFYIFNSIEAQKAMLRISESTNQIMQSITQLMGILSVFVSVVLGFLIVSANQFLIKRRKKEFGVYMTLGMSKGKVARILVAETFLTGVISLAAGLAAGVFFSQWLSILTARMFEVDMTGYVFIFSMPAFIKTILYFGLIFFVVVLFSAISVSRYKLIELIQAEKKNEKPQLKNTAVTVLLFILALVLIITAYILVLKNGVIESRAMTIFIISLGAAGTFLFFASLSGFFLKILKNNKKRYYRGLNMFILRQIDSRINSTYRSFSVICLLLFFTVTVFSFGFGMNAAIQETMENTMPYDVVLFTKEPVSINQTLEQNGLDLSAYTDAYAESPIYKIEEITNTTVLGREAQALAQGKVNIPMDSYAAVIRLSDYNREMEMQNKPAIALQEGQVAFQTGNASNIKNALLAYIRDGYTLPLGGKEYSVYPELLTGGLALSLGDSNFTVIVPDAAAEGLPAAQNLLYFNCSGDTDETQSRILDDFTALYAAGQPKTIVNVGGGVVTQGDEAFPVSLITRNQQKELYAGSRAIISYVGIYLGTIFLITSAAILALQQLSEMADNRRRYAVLKKIGVDDKMTSRAILKQTAVYFLLPLALACVHSVVGLTVINGALASVGHVDAFFSTFVTAAVLLAVLGGYFLATYLGSRNMILKGDLLFD